MKESTTFIFTPIQSFNYKELRPHGRSSYFFLPIYYKRDHGGKNDTIKTEWPI